MKKLSIAVACVSMVMVFMTALMLDAGAQDASSLSGKVVETMDSAGYTYTLIQKNDKTTWVAVPQTKIEKGQTIAFQPGMVMYNFKSKTLNRSFEVIHFSGGVIK